MTTENTVTTHTPINLAPGIDLMVRADLAEDSVTLALVDQCKELLNRPAHIETIEAAIADLVAAGDDEGYGDCDKLEWGLVGIAEMAGFHLAREEDWAFYGKAILAFLPILDDARIFEVAKVAEFEHNKLYAAQKSKVRS